MTILRYLALWFFRFVLGACAFGFVNAAVRRLSKGESRRWDWSRRPGCGMKISTRNFWIELLGGVLSICCALRWGGGTARAVLAFLVLAVLTEVALLDYDTGEILDRFHVILIVLSLAALGVFRETGLVSRLIGCAAVSIPMLGIALLIPGGFGGGDIKLSFALGLLLGWRGILCAIFSAILLAGLHCVWSLARRRAGWKTQFPFGPYLCAGAAFALFYGNECVERWLHLYDGC